MYERTSGGIVNNDDNSYTNALRQKKSNAEKKSMEQQMLQLSLEVRSLHKKITELENVIKSITNN